jgi:hypothetical protein
MPHRRILLQLDTDAHASVFDSVVAIDAGVDVLLPYGDVAADNVRDLVYGCIFTRGPEDLKNTAIFIGGSKVDAGEKLLAAVTRTFFGPMRVSVMMDANGANTTAAAAVLAALKHIQPPGAVSPLPPGGGGSGWGAVAVVLAGTGPVGQRAARLLARAGGSAVRVGSRQKSKAEQVCAALAGQVPGARFEPVPAGTADEVAAALRSAQAVIAAGAPGALLLPLSVRQAAKDLKVAIDLNAVPPLGIEGVKSTDKAADRDGVVAYGAIGVGGTKMKIHKAALQKLFERSDLVLDAEEIFELGQAQ